MRTIMKAGNQVVECGILTTVEEKRQGLIGVSTPRFTPVVLTGLSDDPAESTIHTRGVPYAIDVVCLNPDNRVVALLALEPGAPDRALPRGTVTIVELPADGATELGIRVGSWVEFEPALPAA